MEAAVLGAQKPQRRLRAEHLPPSPALERESPGEAAQCPSLRVTTLRLRKKAAKPGEADEVELPAYEALRKDGCVVTVCVG
jgi:hypothetical protein